MNSNNLVCVEDYEKEAMEILGKLTRDYYATGADDEQTLADNITDYERFIINPRMMVDVSNVKLDTTILGEKISFPICVAPSGIHKLAHPDGETATARGSNVSAGELTEQVPDLLLWFQLYVCRDRLVTRQLVERAERAGCKALVVTVDRPEQGFRRSSHRNKFAMPPHLSFANLDGLEKQLKKGSKMNQNSQYAFLHAMFDNKLTWEDVRWLTTITKLPVVAKGILTGYDARKALEVGCKAIYVSNHGGRQLDGVCSSISALTEVVKAVNGEVEVYVDGGVRKGTDVLKALALGARAVFVGRPPLYGLAVGGEEGARRILTILRDELQLAMQLSGVTDVEKIPESLLTFKAGL